MDRPFFQGQFDVQLPNKDRLSPDGTNVGGIDDLIENAGIQCLPCGTVWYEEVFCQDAYQLQSD